ncbi:MAG: TrpB-like pyridoxal phosphate-dependent enzyme [Oscillospiraceae bacterium]|nr:TrpB-like pyridoxal phosphate-dependent enzyme [Oscillospiraceae bacterium]
MAKALNRFVLPEERIPDSWYNLRADMRNKPASMLHPGLLRPMLLEELCGVFAEELAKQELDDTSEYVSIPGGVMDYYRTFRPSPLCRAHSLEKALQTPAKIYYKFEGNNTSGSHKLNSAAAQAYYAREQGLKGVTTETGAGQWGTALSMACAHFGLECRVFMVKVSAEQKPYRRAVMETFGAKIVASPSDTTKVGRDILAKNPDTGGSLGCAISEAMETAFGLEGYRYVLGSVMNHVLLHQSVIGLEAKLALDEMGEQADIVIGCTGGGSNMGGLMAPFVRDKLRHGSKVRLIAVEPASCPSFTRGKFAYDCGDTGRMTPFIKMYTLGCEFMPGANHAGGLRYHGMSPILSQLYYDKVLDEVRAEGQTAVFDAAVTFARAEGVLPAPESAHAIRGAIDEAIRCREEGTGKTILFGLSGTGYFDMTAYKSYIDGAMTDHIPTDAELAASLASLPKAD